MLNIKETERDVLRRQIKQLIDKYGPEEALKLYFPNGLPRAPIVGPHSPVKKVVTLK